VFSSPFRDAASVHVNASPERVRSLISRPGVLQALDERLQDKTVRVETSDDTVEVHDEDGNLRVAFRLRDEGDGTRVAALETFQPDNVLEATKHMLMPGKAHREFKAELRRLRHLIEDVDVGAPP
jgi:hypothetical protein